MKNRLGFIGAGNMGQAIIKGLLSSELYEPSQITVFDNHTDTLRALSERFNINTARSESEVANQSDMLFLAVKPHSIRKVLHTIKTALTTDKVIISIAAGVSIEAMEIELGTHYKIVRVMPNTPALVNSAMSSVTPNKNVTSTELGNISAILNTLGKSEKVPEHLIHAVTGISGSSPAYVFMFIEAMADAAVLAGMPRAQAYQFSAQAVMGSAKMVLETGLHPAVLKDMVCSPAGTTIEALKTLEQSGFRSAIINAVTSCIEKSKNLSSKLD